MGFDYRLKLGEIRRSALLGWHKYMAAQYLAIHFVSSFSIAQKGYKKLIIKI